MLVNMDMGKISEAFKARYSLYWLKSTNIDGSDEKATTTEPDLQTIATCHIPPLLAQSPGI